MCDVPDRHAQLARRPETGARVQRRNSFPAECSLFRGRYDCVPATEGVLGQSRKRRPRGVTPTRDPRWKLSGLAVHFQICYPSQRKGLCAQYLRNILGAQIAAPTRKLRRFSGAGDLPCPLGYVRRPFAHRPQSPLPGRAGTRFRRGPAAYTYGRRHRWESSYRSDREV